MEFQNNLLLFEQMVPNINLMLVKREHRYR